MIRPTLIGLALLAGLAFGTGAAVAQDSGPLIQLLVRKGIISDQEAEELRAELLQEFATAPAGKLNLSSGLTEFRLSGDARVRYESRRGELPSNDRMSRDRFRYRLRAGISGRVLNDWAFGLRLETSTGSRSSNVTMGDDAGPFAKNSDTVNVGQIYAQWLPNPNFSLIAGRMPNPLVTSSMMWDGDINPEGIAEKFTRRMGEYEFSANLGQFLYSAASTQNPFGPGKTDDLFLFAWQGGLRRYTGEGVTKFFQINPTLYHYVSNNRNNPAAFRGSFTPANTAAVNNLFIFDVPLEYDWVTAGGIPLRAFADVAVNLDGDDRARKFGRPDLDSEDLAWQVGFQYNRAVNPREWDFRVFYQSVGAFALDPNLVDSDLFDSRTNMQGLVVSGNYALGSATLLTVTAASGERVKDSIIAPGAGDIGSNNLLDDFWLLQVDLNLRY